MSQTMASVLLPRPRSMVMMLLLIPGAESLHIVLGGHNIPHPAKAMKGGEDAFFFDDRLGIFGVADGVGGSRTGDSGAFSREVLRRVHQSTLYLGSEGATPKLTEALELASMAPISMGGSTTVVLGHLEPGGILRLLNLGDSGFILLRPAIRKFGDEQEFSVLFPRCVMRSWDQTHFYVSRAARDVCLP